MPTVPQLKYVLGFKNSTNTNTWEQFIDLSQQTNFENEMAASSDKIIISGPDTVQLTWADSPIDSGGSESLFGELNTINVSGSIEWDWVTDGRNVLFLSDALVCDVSVPINVREGDTALCIFISINPTGTTFVFDDALVDAGNIPISDIQLNQNQSQGIQFLSTNGINVGNLIPIVDSREKRNNGLTIFDFTITNDIVVLDGNELNFFNKSNGILSTNGTLTISGDSWNRMVAFDDEFVKPDSYVHTEQQYQQIETLISGRFPSNIGGNQIRGLKVEIRRRTAASPTIPLAISGREIILSLNGNLDALSFRALPTRSEGATDNYNVYGYTLFLVNNSGANITLLSGEKIRFEFQDFYKKPISFNTLTSPNV